MISVASFFKEEKDFLYIRGKAKGRVEGEANGEKRNKKETALKMKERGLELSLISDITKLPIEEIENL